MASTDNKDDVHSRLSRSRPSAQARQPAPTPDAPAANALRTQTHTDSSGTGNGHWDEEDADALADSYEQAGHQIVDAAAWSRSPWLDTALVAPRPPRPAAIDQEWGKLSVTAAGPQISATWNEKPLLTATDPHPQAGRAGLATAGPGSVSFDEFVFEPAPAH